MNQKGFANVVLIVLVIILAGTGGYFTFVKKSEPVTQQTTPPPATTQTQIPQSSVISGEYEYSDMAGFSIFRTTNGPFATPASIITKTKQESGIPAGSTSGFPLHNAIVGTLNPLGDTCSLVIEATVEIANPEKTGDKDRRGNEVVRADFVRLVSKGKVFDNCSNMSGDGTSTRTERKP